MALSYEVTPPIRLWSSDPKPVFLVELGDVDEYLPRLDWTQLFRQASDQVPDLTLEMLLDARYRGVPFSALDNVLRTGIDVEPTTYHIWVDGFEKAMEYGGWPKVLSVIGNDALDHTYRLVRPDRDPDEIDNLRRQFPTEISMPDGRQWLSRLPPDTAGSAYELAHARWIPGSALDALRCVFVMTHPRYGGIEAIKPTLARMSRHRA